MTWRRQSRFAEWPLRRPNTDAIAMCGYPACEIEGGAAKEAGMNVGGESQVLIE